MELRVPFYGFMFLKALEEYSFEDFPQDREKKNRPNALWECGVLGRGLFMVVIWECLKQSGKFRNCRRVEYV